jgi:uncharacterized protein (TIGR02594 family)
MMITAVDLAQRFIGMKETPGIASNPMILAMLRLDDSSVQSDEVPWCSAFLNFVAWLLRLPRSKSLAARSWLSVGVPVEPIEGAEVGNDVVVLARGTGAQGHVGLFMGFGSEGAQTVYVLGGNQGDAVSVATFPRDRILGIRRLA